MSVSPRLALPFYFTHFLPHSFRFLLRLNFVDNLRIPPKESMDLSDDFLLTTGYEPNAYDFKETSVEPYTELLDSPPLFSDKISSADADYGDAALKGMLREAHRVHSHHSPQEDLSVSLSSSVSDRTERPVGDRMGRKVEQRNQEAQIWTLLDKKSKFLQSAKQELTNTNFKPLTTEEVHENQLKLLNLSRKNFIALKLKKFNNEINSFFKDNYCIKTWNYVKVIR